MANKNITNNKQIIYPKESYKIIGAAFRTYNNLGYGHPEKYYEKAIATGLDKEGISFERQKHFNLTYKGTKIGEYYLDFLINKKIILELKKGNYFSKRNIEGYKTTKNSE